MASSSAGSTAPASPAGGSSAGGASAPISSNVKSRSSFTNTTSTFVGSPCSGVMSQVYFESFFASFTSEGQSTDFTFVPESFS